MTEYTVSAMLNECFWGPEPIVVAAWLIAELQWKFDTHAHTVRQEGSLTSGPR